MEDNRAMSISDLLKRHLPKGTKQEGLAEQWCAALAKRTGQKLNAEGFESRFSEAFRGKKEGLKALFVPEERAEVTCGVLNIPEPEWPEIKRAVLGSIGL